MLALTLEARRDYQTIKLLEQENIDRECSYLL